MIIERTKLVKCLHDFNDYELSVIHDTIFKDDTKIGLFYVDDTERNSPIVTGSTDVLHRIKTFLGISNAELMQELKGIGFVAHFSTNVTITSSDVELCNGMIKPIYITTTSLCSDDHNERCFTLNDRGLPVLLRVLNNAIAKLSDLKLTYIGDNDNDNTA